MVRRVLASDLMRICFWYRERGLEPPALRMFSDTGFIEPDVGAGFVYLTNSGLCLLDTYVTNPRAPLRARHKALASVTASLLQCAKQAGAAQVVALCRSRGIQTLSKRFGLRPLGVYAMAAKDLT